MGFVDSGHHDHQNEGGERADEPVDESEAIGEYNHKLNRKIEEIQHTCGIE